MPGGEISLKLAEIGKDDLLDVKSENQGNSILPLLGDEVLRLKVWKINKM